MRKILIILLVLIFILLGAWYFFIKPKMGEGVTPVQAFRSFFPIGSDIDLVLSNPSEVDTGTPNEFTIGGTQRKFTQITTMPVAGFSLFSKTNTVTTPAVPPETTPTTITTTDYFLRYVSRETGYVYERKNNDRGIQISNIFIPNIYEAFFMDNNKTAILRFLRPDDQTIATYSVPIPELNANGTRTQQKGYYLSDNIQTVATNPNAATLLELTTTPAGSVLSNITAANTNKKDIFKSPLREWLVYWTENSTVYLQTKASGAVSGFLYKLDQREGRLSRIIGDIPGLTASVSPNNKFVLYSMSTEEGFITRLLDLEKNTTATVNISILPEKCAWLKDNNLICAGNTVIPPAKYPDSWYAGIINFSDQLYKIDTKTNTQTMLFNGTEFVFDMTHLVVDEARNILFFIDKPTGMLWQVTL